MVMAADGGRRGVASLRCGSLCLLEARAADGCGTDAGADEGGRRWWWWWVVSMLEGERTRRWKRLKGTEYEPPPLAALGESGLHVSLG